MIPQRFVTEYPQRCGQLLEMMEAQVREADLLGSFSLMIASAAFNIPFARMSEAAHPLGAPEQGLQSAIRKLKNTTFLKAPFCQDVEFKIFRYARIVTEPNSSHGWRTKDDKHPIQSEEEQDANTVLRVMRNALAHGNVIYLDENGIEARGQKLRLIGFLSRHDDGESHRLVIFGEEDFLIFIRSWIKWLQGFPSEMSFEFDQY